MVRLLKLFIFIHFSLSVKIKGKILVMAHNRLVEMRNRSMGLTPVRGKVSKNPHLLMGSGRAVTKRGGTASNKTGTAATRGGTSTARGGTASTKTGTAATRGGAKTDRRGTAATRGGVVAARGGGASRRKGRKI